MEDKFDADWLLGHLAWMRALARSLVREDESEDLVQEAWIAAARRPPRDTSTITSWLKVVLVNLARRHWRDEASRRRREMTTARPECVPATAEDLVGRAEMQRLLVDLVLGLDEPYRSAVLLRFFEGLTPEAIAQREGIPVSTVRTRLRRALERLRERLDRRYGGDRRAWCLAFLPLTGFKASVLSAGGGTAAAAGAIAGATPAPGSAAALVLGGIMTMKSAVAIGLAAVLPLALGVGIGTLAANSGAELKELAALRSRYARTKSEIDRLRMEVAQAGAKVARAAPPPTKGTVPEASAVPPEVASPPSRKLDFTSAMEKIIKSGLHRTGLITAGTIEDTLEKNGRAPRFLIAAANFSEPDRSLAYLQEALEKDPGSPLALLIGVYTLLAKGEADAEAADWIERLKQADPSNSLPCYLAARAKMASDDLGGALREMREATARSFLNDYHLNLLPESATFLRESGWSEGAARAIAFSIDRIDDLAPLRRLGEDASIGARARLREGSPQDALALARLQAQLGQRLAVSSRTLVGYLVGTATETEALLTEKEVEETLGNRERIDEIEKRIENLRNGVERLKRTGEALSASFSRFSEADMHAYIERVLRDGELHAASDLPGVKEALRGQGGEERG